MVHATCAALHCLSSSNTDKGLKFHQFPHDAERRKMWLTACKRSDVIDKDWNFFKHKYVCSLHFQKCMYSKKNHLKKSAIPSLHLSEKPLQHESSTQTVESIQYVNQQSENDEKILYVMPNVKKSSTTTYTQTKHSLPDAIKHINIKEEIITQSNIGVSESVEQDVEIKTENDDDYGEDSDSGEFEEDVEMKTEIVENEILPLVQSTLSLQSTDLEITKEGRTLSIQAKNLLQEIDQGSKATIVNGTESNPINTSMTPILKRKMDGSIQTDRVIVLSHNADGSEGSINPEECTCNRNNYVDMTRPQFYRACSKFVSANFATTVRREMYLDDVSKQGGNKLSEAGSSGNVKAGAAECVENAAGCEVVVAPNVIIASTETVDSTAADLYAADRVDASAADCARRRRPRGRRGRSGPGRAETPVMVPSSLTPSSAPSSAPTLPLTIRRPRTRGGRGRGVRVRGGRGTASVPRADPVVEEISAVVVTSGSPTARGRGRGRRQIYQHVRPGLHNIEDIKINELLEFPEAQGLETPLHPYRKRRWPTSDLDYPDLLAPPPPPSSPPPPSQATLPPSPRPEPRSPLPAAAEMFVESDGWQSAPPASPSQAPLLPPPPRRSRQFLRDGEVVDFHNYGSDSGSDESDEDGDTGMVPVIIPRVYRTTLETPLDADADDDGDAGGEVTPATDPSPAAPAEEPASVPSTATDQPWRWFDFEWKDFPNSSNSAESRRETFSQSNVGPTTPRDDPYDCFIDIWDRPIMEHIASETNKYAQEVAAKMLANNNLHPMSRIRRWCDTTVDELYTFFGLILAMGVVVKSRLEEYWAATPDIFYTPGFSAHMSIDRFVLLLKCLHFNNNDDTCALELDGSQARLHKIQPILSHLNMKFQALYTPAQNIALDESLLMWKGWLDIGQLIPNKAARKGIKSYEICESQTGYLWRFEIHSHKKSDTPPQPVYDPLEASTPSIVLRLTQGLEHKGYTLWMDNFYNSPCLARRLKSLGFDCVGTLRTDRQFVPQALHNLTKQNMRKGQIAGLTSGDVDVMVWKDNNRVAMISTYHGNGRQTIRGSTKPILILDYNIMMGGVDKKDQLLAMFPVERKRTKVWYKKLFRRLLNVSVLNSFIIYHHHSPRLTHRNFRITLIRSLLSKHTTSHSIVATSRDIRFLVGQHFLKLYETDARSRHNRRRCTVCKQRTRMFCAGCDKAFCFTNCFHQFHS